MKSMIAMLLAVFALAACESTPRGGEPSSVWSMRSVTTQVVTAKQTPAVDQEVAGHSAGQYFLRLRAFVKQNKPGFSGADGVVKMSVRNGNQVHFEQSCTLDDKGICEAQVPMSAIKPNSSLCVETPWPIAHQRLKPDYIKGNAMCADGIYDYFVLGRREGKFVVAAIKSAG